MTLIYIDFTSLLVGCLGWIVCKCGEKTQVETARLSAFDFGNAFQLFIYLFIFKLQGILGELLHTIPLHEVAGNVEHRRRYSVDPADPLKQRVQVYSHQAADIFCQDDKQSKRLACTCCYWLFKFVYPLL